MRTLIIILFVMATMVSNSQEHKTIADKILNLEKAALERWNNGDPSGFLEISADDVVYFDPYLDQRVDGKEKLGKLYENIRGQVKVDKDIIKNPLVQAVENMAVLTFNLESYSGGKMYRWNCTEVYRLEKDGNWKIIQTHWSYTKPDLK